MKATSFSSSISANLGNSGEAMKYSQVLGQAMKKRPTGHYKKYSHFKGRDTAPTTSSRVGSCIVDSSTSGERTLLAVAVDSICTLRHFFQEETRAQFYHVTVRRMTKYFVQRCQSIYVYNLRSHTHAHKKNFGKCNAHTLQHSV